MALFRDQLDQLIDLPSLPQRIISLVPSQTELLFDLGLREQIIGITDYCIHPKDKVASVTKIGGTKRLNIPLIKQMQPDLIIANKEENERAQIEELVAHFPVWISDINDLPGALDMIEKVGELTGKGEAAQHLSSEIQEAFDKLQPVGTNPSVLYLIWRKPYMAAGSDTFINDMLQRCGLVNAVTQARYPELTAATIAEINPDLIFLSSEPYPFKQKHVDELQALLPTAKIMLVDGEMFSWYGSRLQFAAQYFSQLMNQMV